MPVDGEKKKLAKADGSPATESTAAPPNPSMVWLTLDHSIVTDPDVPDPPTFCVCAPPQDAANRAKTTKTLAMITVLACCRCGCFVCMSL